MQPKRNTFSTDASGHRFAPTPTGELHLGNVRTALIAYLAARTRKERFILRMDDLDPLAVKNGAIEQQLDDLDWLGIKFDEGLREGGPFLPYNQSARSILYEKVLSDLNELELLYPCWCSRKEVLAAAQAPHACDEGPIYPHTCKPRTTTKLESLAQVPLRNGRRPSLRLDVNKALSCIGRPRLEFMDGIFGHQVIDPISDFGDFVVRRKDGVASYQLACAYDDWQMKCGLVLRGADLLLSTGRQLLFFYLFNWTIPEYAHVGLMLDADGDRLSKRDQAISVSQLRRAGVAPDVILDLLAQSIGLAPRLSLVQMVDAFMLDESLKNPVRLPEQPPWKRTC